MTAPAQQCVDPALEVVTVAVAALRQGFDPTSECPPDGGGSTTVRFFANDGGLPFWDGKCKEPFLWVRVHQRYRSTTTAFPSVVTSISPCTPGAIRVLAVELGVARCATADERPSWSKLEKEADISLDDSWRIERALQRIAARLGSKERAVGADSIAPLGPEGTVTAQIGMAYVQY